MKFTALSILLVMMALSLLPGCRGGNVPHSGDTGQNMMRHARNITMTEE